MSHQNHCFATLALRPEYRFYARELAIDLEFYSPGTPLVVLTDAPGEFRSHANVLAIPHSQQSILRCFHDHRHVVDQALGRFKTCIVVNANVRLLEPVPPSLPSRLAQGVVTEDGATMQAHFDLDRKDPALNPAGRFSSIEKEHALTRGACEYLGISMDQATYVCEVIYAVTCDGPQKARFIDVWGRLARYFEYHGMTWGEGRAIGIAAHVAGLPVKIDQFIDRSIFYKHRIHGNLLQRRLPVSRRIEICHGHRQLADQYPRFFALPGRWRQQLQRAWMLQRWLRFRLTSPRYGTLESLRD